MKTKYTTIMGALGLGLALSSTSVMYADQATALKETLSSVALSDLPAQAAKLVTEAKAKEQKSVTIAVVRAAVERDPAAAPLIVSAVAKAVPAVASVAAATAAAMVPNQARAIAKAAAAAAPSQAKEIVLAIYKELHGSYAAVAIGASEGAPASSQQILALIPKA